MNHIILNEKLSNKNEYLNILNKYNYIYRCGKSINIYNCYYIYTEKNRYTNIFFDKNIHIHTNYHQDYAEYMKLDDKFNELPTS